MRFEDYVCEAKKTAFFKNEIPKDADPKLVSIFYCTLKLNGEAGEVAEQVGKAFRDDDGKITPERLSNIVKEIGDVLWYLGMLSEMIGIPLSVCARTNLDKLSKRAAEGKLGGSGSNR